jgi:hypothetical protein
MYALPTDGGIHLPFDGMFHDEGMIGQHADLECKFHHQNHKSDLCLEYKCIPYLCRISHAQQRQLS